jgi:outer membrane receptor protein involved in Fe transport
MAGSLIVLPPAGNAQDDTASPAIEEIVVTGSRIKRRDLDAPSPIVTLEREQLSLAPQPTLEQTLNRMPQLTGDYGRTSNNPGNGTASLNLRGMGSERTLVLLNARRVAPSGVGSSVDVNNIPQILIDRVELITGGASTVYGSDALAGVVNFITRDDFEGITFESRYGVTDEGDAAYTDINLALGTDFADGRGNVVVYGGYYDRELLLSSARSLTNVTWMEDGFGELFEAGSFSIPAGLSSAQVPNFGFPTFNADGTPRPFVNPDDQYNFAPYNYLQTPLTRYSAGVLGTLAVGNGYEMYLESSFAQNDAASELAPVPSGGQIAVNTDNPLLTPATAQLFQANYTDPAAANPLLAVFPFQRRLTELGSRHLDYDQDYWRTVVGLRGELGRGWDIDGWLSYTTLDETTLQENDGSRTRFRQGLLVDPATGQCFDPSGGCVPIDPFGAGRMSAEAVNFLKYGPLRSTTSRTQKLASVFITGTPANTWAGPLDVATGLEWRSDTVDFVADDVLFTGDTLGYRGDAPIDGTENVTEIYAEAVVPILAALPAAELLQLELGARYSNYDNAGGVWTYKLGGSWIINDALRIRSMFQSSVRAPNNQELFQQQYAETFTFSGATTDLDPCSASQDPVANGFADACIVQGLPPSLLGVFEAIPLLPVDYILGGNPDLVPEEAETLTVGFAYTSGGFGNWTLAVDYFDIDISKSIGEIVARSICFDPANTGNAFCDKIFRYSDPNDPLVGNVYEVEELFNNRGKIASNGIDTQLNFDFELPDSLAIAGDGANLSVYLAWTHVLDLIYQGNPVSTVEYCTGYFDSPCTGFSASSTAPDDRVSVNFLYQSGSLSASLLAQWISGTRSYEYALAQIFGDPEPVLAVPTIGSEFYLDLNLAYRFNDYVSARFGVANLLDADAPLMPGVTNNSDTQLYDVFGRSYSLTLVLNFDRAGS